MFRTLKGWKGETEEEEEEEEDLNYRTWPAFARMRSLGPRPSRKRLDRCQNGK